MEVVFGAARRGAAPRAFFDVTIVHVFTRTEASVGQGWSIKWSLPSLRTSSVKPIDRPLLVDGKHVKEAEMFAAMNAVSQESRMMLAMSLLTGIRILFLPEKAVRVSVTWRLNMPNA